MHFFSFVHRTEFPGSTSELQFRSIPASFGWKIIFLSLFFIDPSQTRWIRLCKFSTHYIQRFWENVFENSRFLWKVRVFKTRENSYIIAWICAILTPCQFYCISMSNFQLILLLLRKGLLWLEVFGNLKKPIHVFGLFLYYLQQKLEFLRHEPENWLPEFLF